MPGPDRVSRSFEGLRPTAAAAGRDRWPISSRQSSGSVGRRRRHGSSERLLRRGCTMSDSTQFYSVAWIYTYDRRTGRLMSSRRASAEDLRELESQPPVTEEPPVPTGPPASYEPYGGGEVTTYTYSVDVPPPPRFEHDPAARVF